MLHGKAAFEPFQASVQRFVLDRLTATIGRSIGVLVGFITQHRFHNDLSRDARNGHTARAAGIVRAGAVVVPATINGLISSPIIANQLPRFTVDGHICILRFAQAQDRKLSVAAINRSTGSASFREVIRPATGTGTILFLLTGKFCRQAQDLGGIASSIFGGRQGHDLQRDLVGHARFFDHSQIFQRALHGNIFDSHSTVNERHQRQAGLTYNVFGAGPCTIFPLLLQQELLALVDRVLDDLLRQRLLWCLRPQRGGDRYQPTERPENPSHARRRQSRLTMSGAGEVSVHDVLNAVHCFGTPIRINPVRAGP